MAPPQLNAEQRARALEKAAMARRKRAEIKSLLKNGSLSLGDLLEQAADDPMVSGIKVSAVLTSMPRTGKVKAGQIMEELGIAENRRVRGLGARQRSALLAKFS
ncbi:MAG: integration host factor, actinobacterial type [bacterium]|nr:integration host factor, actinobacterial type [bacterium]MDE0351732.1 integration host factor, actinobacterial type [bacterium]